MSPRLFWQGFFLTVWLSSLASSQLRAQSPQMLVPVTPCRVVDTRLVKSTFGGPIMAASSTRSFPIPQSSCGIPSTATAYLLNVTVVPLQPFGYLTLWATGQPQPLTSTLNVGIAQPTANSATVSAGTNGAVSVYVTNLTHVILDITGYYVPVQSFSDGETPAGIEDATNRTFTLAHTPANNSTPLFILNGVVQKLGTDYVLNGTTITVSLPPQPDDALQVWYRY